MITLEKPSNLQRQPCLVISRVPQVAGQRTRPESLPDFDDYNHIDGKPGKPFSILFDPDVQQLAIKRQRAVETGTQTDFVGGLNIERLAGLRGSCSNPSSPLKSLISRVLRGKKPLTGRGHPAVRTDSCGPVVRNSLQSQTRLSFPNQKRVVADYLDGVPVNEIATRFHIHRETVHQINRRAGVSPRPRGFSDSVRREAARLYAEGLTIEHVAEALGIGREATRTGIIACGLTPRPRGRRRIQV